jgi:hypothetical protein
MCIYYTFHFSCCIGVSAPAPYYLQELCPSTTASPAEKTASKKCKIEHQILDGSDYDDILCPKCGRVGNSGEEDDIEAERNGDGETEAASSCT